MKICYVQVGFIMNVVKNKCTKTFNYSDDGIKKAIQIYQAIGPGEKNFLERT